MAGVISTLLHAAVWTMAQRRGCESYSFLLHHSAAPGYTFDTMIIPKFLEATKLLMTKSGVSCNGYAGLDDFILQHGRHWTPQALPAGYKPARTKECFMNATNLAIRHRNLTYVEGYACGIIPVIHAWCVDSEGRVIDPTWENRYAGGDWMRGTEYFGIPIKTDYLRQQICSQKTYGLLQQWQANYPIIHDSPELWKETKA